MEKLDEVLELSIKIKRLKKDILDKEADIKKRDEIISRLDHELFQRQRVKTQVKNIVSSLDKGILKHLSNLRKPSPVNMIDKQDILIEGALVNHSEMKKLISDYDQIAYEPVGYRHNLKHILGFFLYGLYVPLSQLLKKMIKTLLRLYRKTRRLIS